MPETQQCPRCHRPFACGAQDTQPCACQQVQLSEQTLAWLRSQYASCLCGDCLREIQAQHQAADHQTHGPSKS